MPRNVGVVAFAASDTMQPLHTTVLFVYSGTSKEGRQVLLGLKFCYSGKD
jgi:hypothetical protein